jgi:hypothetical protein
MITNDINWIYITNDTVTVRPEERRFVWSNIFKNYTLLLENNDAPLTFRSGLTSVGVDGFDYKQPFFYNFLTGEVLSVNSIERALDSINRYTYRPVPIITNLNSFVTLLFGILFLIIIYILYFVTSTLTSPDRIKQVK